MQLGKKNACKALFIRTQRKKVVSPCVLTSLMQTEYYIIIEIIEFDVRYDF